MTFVSLALRAIASGTIAFVAAVAVPASSQTPAASVELTLEQAVQLAVSRSFRTARASRSRDIAQLRHDSARSAYHPRANVGFSADQRARGFGYALDPYQTDFRAGLGASVSVPLDVSGIIRRQVGQAAAQREISAREVDQVTLDVTVEAQNNYLNALRAQSNVVADEKVVAQIDSLLERSRMSAPGVVPFLEVEIGNAQQSLTNSRTNADQAQDGLKQTLRMPLDSRLRLTSDLTDDTLTIERGDLLQRALAARPDVQQAELRIRQAELSQQQASDHRRPAVSIGGRYGEAFAARSILDSSRRRVTDHGFGVNLNVPIAQYDRGQLAKQKRIAGIQKDQAMADAGELRERVEYDLRQALLAVERAENRIQNLPDRNQAYEALQRAEQQMLSASEGQAQSLLAQVSNARNAWRSAQTASADAFIDYNRAVFRLKRTLGETDAVEPVREAVAASIPIVGGVEAF